MRQWISAAIAGVVLLAAGVPALAAPPPAESFGNLQAIQQAAISPDGRRIAYIGGAPNRRILSIAPIDAGGSENVDLGDVRALSVEWAGPNYVLAHVIVQSKLGTDYIYDFHRTMVFDVHARLITHLMTNGEENNYASSLPVLRVTGGAQPTAYVEGLDYISQMRAENISRFKRDTSGMVLSIWKVDVATGRGTVVERGQSQTFGWALDLNGDAQAKIESTADPEIDTISIRTGPQSWRQVMKGKVSLEGYADRERAVYWREIDPVDGFTRIKKVDVASGAVSLVGPARPHGDAWLMWDDLTDTPAAIAEDDGSLRTWLDPQIEAVAATLSRAFRGRVVEVENWSADRTRYVFRVRSADAPGEWYLYDTVRKEASSIGPEYPQLAGQTLSATRFFSYPARDGLTIPAYLRVPAGGPSAKLPLIVMPHGGPGARDDGDFDWWAAFLVSRGYAVFQPEFRGSDGFGEAFLRAGDGEWGGKMQTDIMDGVNYLAREGTIDPARMCIIGGSYGGFAALQNLVQFPGTYRCAVSVNGVTDPGQLVSEAMSRQGEDSGAVDYLRKELGLKEHVTITAAPARHAAEIDAPVLLIYSDKDARVPPIQSQRMAKALQSAGKPVEVVVLPGDDHFLLASASRVKMLQAIDGFLAKYLPVTP